MTNRSYLAYFPDPFGTGNSKYFVLNEHGEKLVRPVDLAAEFPSVVTYDAPALIDDLRRLRSALPTEIVDVTEALRLAVGLSKSDGGEKRWDFWRAIKSYYSSEADWGKARALHHSRARRFGDDEERLLLSETAQALGAFWISLNRQLVEKGESDRFFQIEVPCAQVFYSRQYVGLPIDEENVSSCLRAANYSKYSAYRAVANELGISPTGLTYWNVSKHLASTDVARLSSVTEGYALRDQLKMSRDISHFAKVFTELMDAGRDVDVLTRLSDSTGRVYPTFHPAGTISGRVLVSDPHLQELSRRYRGVIAAEPGCELAYYDYSQFEPGIMASMSRDPDLIALYNAGDVYKALSEALFGDESHRDLCKRIFLAFSYGMSPEGISRLLATDSTENERAAVEVKVRQFFAKFRRLAEFKGELEASLRQSGSVQTLLGNRRVRAGDGPLKSKERRWAVSQVIQGNASLIFKRTVINLSKRFSFRSIMLPMHDAVLMQFPLGQRPDSEVRAIMMDAFRESCPGIVPRVTVGSFS